MRMKKWIMAVCVAGVFLCACSSQSRWQKQYDLGIQYLIDENYEEAVVAFQAAIEVEPNQAEGYQGIGQAYQGQAQTLIAENSWEEGLEYYRLAVQAYETAAELKSSAENMEDELDDLRVEISKLEDEIELLEILNTNQVEGNAQDYLELIESVRQCCSAEDYDQVYELMQGETFLTLRNFCTKQKPLIVMGEDGAAEFLHKAKTINCYGRRWHWAGILWGRFCLLWRIFGSDERRGRSVAVDSFWGTDGMETSGQGELEK